MLAAATPAYIEVILFVFAICGGTITIAAAVAFVFAYTRGRRGAAVTTLQNEAIGALEASLSVRERDITDLSHRLEKDRKECESQLKTQEAQILGLQRELTTMKELVTQKASVDELRSEIEHGLGEVLSVVKDTNKVLKVIQGNTAK